jgi:hypothetical protein
MVEQQQFEERFSDLGDLRCVGEYNHFRFDRRCTGRDKLPLPLHFDKAQPASAIGFQSAVEAKIWNIDAMTQGSFKNACPRFYRDFLVVYSEFYHGIHSFPAAAAPAVSSGTPCAANSSLMLRGPIFMELKRHAR